MLKITKPEANRVDIELEGELNSEVMRRGLDELLEQSADIKNGRMLYRITRFGMPTMGAMRVEMERLPKLFGLISKFDRCAVLTDHHWLRTAAEIEGALIPGLRIKSFPLDQEERAERWLAGG